MTRLFRRDGNERGAALIEAALTLPLLLLICIGMIEFGRAYQTWQVLTNAAREGARIAVLPGMNNTAVTSRVKEYMAAGQLPYATTATVDIDRNKTVSIGGTATASASEVRVNYPFQFIVLDPIARLAVGGSGGKFTTLNMVAAATMRNES